VADALDCSAQPGGCRQPGTREHDRIPRVPTTDPHPTSVPRSADDMVYILNGEIVSDDDARAIAKRNNAASPVPSNALNVLSVPSKKELPDDNANEPPLIVLDLDGTILETTLPDVRGTKPSYVIRTGGTLAETRLRPGLAEFVDAVLRHGYSLAVWTAAPRAYADDMLGGIERSTVPHFKSSLKCVFAEEQTSIGYDRGRWLCRKELRRLASHTRVPLHRCLIVDDTPVTYASNVRNALPVPAYKGGRSDDVLPQLANFLCSLNIGAGQALDVSGWRYAPHGAGPLTAGADPALEGRLPEGAAERPPLPMWSNRPSAATEDDEVDLT